jgi:carbon-monoxide dehydrogenase medium subunit
MTEYCRPTSVEEAVDLLATHKGAARVIAGGTDVLPDLRRGKIAPACLVDVTQIPQLGRIEVGDDFVRVGAAVTFAQIRTHPFLARHVPALVAAAGSVGAAAIQNAATWVGNIVQAMPAADGAVVAVALEAEARVVDVSGAAWRPVASLFEGPGVSVVDPTRQLVTEIRFPLRQGAWGTAWERIGRRPSLVLPILNSAVSLQLDAAGAEVIHAVVAMGPVAPRPFRARGAEAALEGQPPTEEAFAQAARVACQEAQPRSSTFRASCDYRLNVIPHLVLAALSVAAERAKHTAGST